MTIDEYKSFVHSLGLKTFGLDFPIAPECLAAKAKLVKKYFGVYRLYEHREITQVLSILTPKTLITIFFGCPKADVVSISWRMVDIVTLSDGYLTFKTISNDIMVECSFDDTQSECDKILAEHLG
jgi:hypothetical protein